MSGETVTTETPARRTKRRYAHELYPHPAEDEVRPLAVEVPYLYARAVGFEVFGTEWSKSDDRGSRVVQVIDASRTALLADALAQGMTGDEAWTWAAERCSSDSMGEWVWERATHYGIDTDRIKPYPCGPAPTRHEHMDARRFVTYADGAEDDCPDCTEPVEAGDPS